MNGRLPMGAHFSSATLDDVTMALIQRKTKMKPSEITDWFNELKVSNEAERHVAGNDANYHRQYF